jgi:hypothetical protein
MYRKYLAALWGDWVTRMSGAASIVLAFLAAYWEFIVKHGKVALWIASAVCFVIASYRVWAKERRRLDELTKHKLIFEIDERSTSIRVDQTKSAIRIFANIQLWFENMDIHPLSVKGINFTLHRMGIKRVRDASDIYTLLAILRVSSNGVPINKDDLEGMMIQERRVTPFYLIEAMLAIEDEQIRAAADLDFLTYIKVVLRGSGSQPEFTAKLFPHWEAALGREGMSQITVRGASSIRRDYRSLN